MARQVGIEVSETPVRLRYVRLSHPPVIGAVAMRNPECYTYRSFECEHSNTNFGVFGRFLDARDRRAARSGAPAIGSDS